MKDYAIGYGKTDPKTRWKKGQCGNPHKKRPQKIPNVASMIEDALARKVKLKVKENGTKRWLTIFEVILRRLLSNITRGNRRAMRIRKKYQDYAQARPTVVYVPKTDPEEAAAKYRALLEGTYGPITREEAELAKARSELTAIEADEMYRELLQTFNNGNDYE